MILTAGGKGGVSSHPAGMTLTAWLYGSRSTSPGHVQVLPPGSRELDDDLLRTCAGTVKPVVSGPGGGCSEVSEGADGIHCSTSEVPGRR